MQHFVSTFCIQTCRPAILQIREWKNMPGSNIVHVQISKPGIKFSLKHFSGHKMSKLKKLLLYNRLTWSLRSTDRVSIPFQTATTAAAASHILRPRHRRLDLCIHRHDIFVRVVQLLKLLAGDGLGDGCGAEQGETRGSSRGTAEATFGVR
jgi:hypothetical protein